MNPEDCEHLKVETCYQYDKEKNRTVFWMCPECHMQFEPKGLAYAELKEENETLQRGISFFASVIKSGEKWTQSCQDMYDALIKDGE